VERLTIAHLDKIRGALTLPPRKRKVPDFGPRRADIAARRKRLVAAVAAGKLELDDIDAPIATLDAELADLEAEAAAAEAECTSDTVESRRSALAFIDGIAEAWAGLTPSERRSVIMTLAERITINANGRPAVTWRDASGLAVAVGSADAPPMSRRSTVTHKSQRLRQDRSALVTARRRGAARAIKQQGSIARKAREVPQFGGKNVE
jgi:hypothetical protein